MNPERKQQITETMRALEEAILVSSDLALSMLHFEELERLTNTAFATGFLRDITLLNGGKDALLVETYFKDIFQEVN